MIRLFLFFMMATLVTLSKSSDNGFIPPSSSLPTLPEGITLARTYELATACFENSSSLLSTHASLNDSSSEEEDDTSYSQYLYTSYQTEDLKSLKRELDNLFTTIENDVSYEKNKKRLPRCPQSTFQTVKTISLKKASQLRSNFNNNNRMQSILLVNEFIQNLHNLEQELFYQRASSPLRNVFSPPPSPLTSPTCEHPPIFCNLQDDCSLQKTISQLENISLK